LNGLSWSKPAIYASGNENRIVNNELLNNAVGIKVDGSGNQVAGNRVTGPYTDPYDFAPGNQLELILGQVPETLDWPCSVTFGGTLICSQTGGNGITVNSDDVTIDLAGHALIGPPGGSPGHGVFLAGAIRNVVVRNGIVRNFSDGVHAEYTQDSRFEHLIIATNGNCGVYLVGDGGQCDGNTIADCTISGNSSSGVYLDGLYGQCNGNTLADCTISGNGGDGGVYLRGDVGQCAGNTIADCTIRKNANRGIYMYDADGNRVEGNHITGQTGSPSYGIYCEFTAKNLIFRNTCVGQTTNFTITASDTYGPIVTSTGALPTTGAGAHPLANFDY
jgi:parallel beta-helix repeat protein